MEDKPPGSVLWPEMGKVRGTTGIGRRCSGRKCNYNAIEVCVNQLPLDIVAKTRTGVASERRLACDQRSNDAM